VPLLDKTVQRLLGLKEAEFEHWDQQPLIKEGIPRDLGGSSDGYGIKVPKA